MTNFNTAPTDALPSTPSGHRSTAANFPVTEGITDTQTYRAFMPIWIAQLMRFFTKETVLRGAATRIRALVRTLKALHKTETANYAAWMVQAMKADPDWQSQVRDDLGGEAALLAWEARHARINAPERATTQTTESPATPTQSGDTSSVKTDRHGLFCLAPVEGPARSAPTRPQAYVYRPYAIGFYLRMPKPVPLTPDDLRVSSVVDEPRNVPVLTCQQIRNIWDRIHLDHTYWNYDLVIADLALTHAPTRLELAPP